jgi:hypothetical protein
MTRRGLILVILLYLLSFAVRHAHAQEETTPAAPNRPFMRVAVVSGTRAGIVMVEARCFIVGAAVLGWPCGGDYAPTWYVARCKLNGSGCVIVPTHSAELKMFRASFRAEKPGLYFVVAFAQRNGANAYTMMRRGRITGEE